jgi:hypothetical protein
MRRALLFLLASLLAASAHAATSVARTPTEAADYTVLAGKTVIKTYGERMVGIAVYDPRDSRIHLFRLWTNEAPAAALNIVLENASVEYRGAELVVMSGEPRSFYVFGTAETRFTAPRAPAGYSGLHTIGYGLNHEIRAAAPARTGRVRATEECSDPFLCPFDQDPGGGGSGGGSCQSGGPGSTSCTVNSSSGSCSVSCSAGYYACCNFDPPRCNCNRS